jgi:ComF family protein
MNRSMARRTQLAIDFAGGKRMECGMVALAQLVRPGMHGILDAVLPPRCLRCGTLVEGGHAQASRSTGALCPECWRGLSFLGPPCCACCGLPFEFDLGMGALCAQCTTAPPPFARARAVLRYNEASRDLVLAFKHADRTESTPTFAHWMARAGAELIADCQVIAPVPLHWSRLFGRRYNQSALLAGALGRLGGRPVAARLLVRKRATAPQGHKGRLARQRNVAGALAVGPGQAGLIAGRRVLMIDDVVTTGATAAEAAKILLAAGAKAVDILALAQVVRSD